MSKRKPTHLRLLQGNPSGRPLNTREPVVVPIIPKPPKYLTKGARREWKKIAPLLKDSGLLSNLDTEAFARLCQTADRLHDAELKLQTGGLLVTTPNGYPQQSPYFTVVTNLSKQLMQLLGEFGMTPSSRSGIEVEAKTPVDEFEKFLERGKGTTHR